MKKSVSLVALCFVLAGCGAGSTELSSTSSSAIPSTTESTVEKAALSATTPSYDLDNKTFTILGNAAPKSTIQIFEDKTEKKTITANENGSYEYSGALPAEDTTYRISDGDQNASVFVLSESSVIKQRADQEKADKAAAEKKEKEAEEKQRVEEEQKKKEEADRLKAEAEAKVEPTPASADEVAESSTVETNDESQQTEITSPTDDQKKTLIAWTQMDCEDQGADLTFKGYSAWNVAVNYIDGRNRWIITTEDKKYGRIKSIYEWSGDTDDGATLIYLLINGEELLNNLH